MLCGKSKLENCYVLVGFTTQDEEDSGIEFYIIEPVFDNRNILVGYLIDNEFHPREFIRWFRIKEDRE
jgi:hypothetical protein